ncbi:MAG TPA: nitrogenase iron-molybdenum cofactor biosynthesis protein NifE [Nodularia sp. (in: cyanobacteria)]|nr:nitrogenase iron-molybdenum cofactor biosynthesis protein NifE [Nodularia sp. (in: cyanobacteria)]
MKLTETEIAQLLDQPKCDHHQTDVTKKPCLAPPKPGVSQGGCSFDGAWVSMQPIADVVHLVHGPIACIGNTWEVRGSKSSGEDHLHMRGCTTDLQENDIIFGGEKRLYQAILQVATQYKPAAVFVYNTCIPALIGDDIDAVCKAASEKINLPVIPINVPGFIGGKNFGSRVAGEHILEHVIGTAEPEYTTPYDINLIGDYNISGELWGVLPLFKKLGIRVLSKITGDARYHEICYAHRAKLNIMICSKALLNIAQKMEQKYGIPYLEESFYGIQDVNRCLRNIAAQIGDASLQERTEKLIAEETAKLDVALAPYRARLKGKRMVLYTGGVKSWSIVSAARDLGMEVVATSTRKSTPEDIERIHKLMGPNAKMLDWLTAKELVQTIKETNADILVAGGRSQYAALKACIPFLDINHERHHPYAGYTGMIEMARELDEALHSPVWEQVRQTAPWLRYQNYNQEAIDVNDNIKLDDEDLGSGC